MIIMKRDTVADVIIRNGALFSLGVKHITEQIAGRPAPTYIPMRRRGWFDKRFEARSVDSITMGELDAIEQRLPTLEQFEQVLAVMLGLYKFNKMVDGIPDWTAGIEIDRASVYRLRFIRAYRYFIEIEKQLQTVGKAWKRLEMPKGKDAPTTIKRPNRGMQSVCREYIQLMQGAVTTTQAWNTPWPIVYEAFEDQKYKNLRQREEHERMRAKAAGGRHRR